jgi:hypothetical protein
VTLNDFMTAGVDIEFKALTLFIAHAPTPARRRLYAPTYGSWVK